MNLRVRMVTGAEVSACIVGEEGGEGGNTVSVRSSEGNPPLGYIRLPNHPSSLIPPFFRHKTSPNAPPDVQQHDRTALTIVSIPAFWSFTLVSWARRRLPVLRCC